MLSTPRPKIEQESNPGGRLVWSGQPHCGIRFRIADWIGIPFSVFWCGFAIFWEVMALTAMPKTSDPVTPFFPLFAVPFILIGLYLVFGRFIVDARVRADLLRPDRRVHHYHRRLVRSPHQVVEPADAKRCVAERTGGRQRYHHFWSLARDGAGFPVALVARRPPIRPARRRNDR